jgi:ATP-dependent helicase/DNAse subunit B
MIDHVVKALDRRVAAGEIQPYPFRGKQLVCTTCPYIAVCRFDPAGGDRYRRPIGITPKQLKADLERGPEDGRQAVDGGAS